MNNKVIQLQKGMQTAFVDHLAVSNLAYKPQFISNNYREGLRHFKIICGNIMKKLIKNLPKNQSQQFAIGFLHIYK